MNFSRQEWTSILAIFALTRLLLVVIGVLAILYLPAVKGSEYRHLQTSPTVDMWYRWDAGFYVSIARYGYVWVDRQILSADMAFLPLYPMMIRGLNSLTGCSEAECAGLNGIFISNLALLVATFFMYDLVKQYNSQQTAWRSLWLLMLVPGGVYLSGLYAEAVFFCMSILVFYMLRQDRFYAACVFAGFAAISRPIGLVFYPCLLFYLWQHRATWSVGKLLAAHIPLLTFGAYALAAGIITGDLFAYFDAYHMAWHRTVTSSPFQTLLTYFSGQRVALWGWKLSWIDPLFALFYLALATIVLWRDRLLGLFALGAVLVPITSGNLTGIPRYGIIVFPFYLLLAQWANTRWKQVVWFSLSIIFMILFTARFATWHWLA